MKTNRKPKLSETTLPLGHHPQWCNALIPRGRPGPVLTLARDGRSFYKIVLPAHPTTQEAKAAADLAQWLCKIAGARFHVLREGAAGAGNGRIISVGHTTIWARAYAGQNDADLGAAGYAIAIKGKTIFMQGGSQRGPINAAYALLEEDLGCRWYDEGGGTILRRRDLTVRIVPRRYTPALDVRDPYYWEAWNGDWSLRNRTNSPEAAVPMAWGGHMRAPSQTAREKGYQSHAEGWFVHTFNRFAPPERYFKKHPEYYSEHAGVRAPLQLCLANPQVLALAIAKVREVLRRNPEARMISVSPNDRQDYCTCAACRAIDKAQGSSSGSLIRFVNAVADAVCGEFPQVAVTTLAYLGTLMPPRTIRPRNNVIVYLCTDRHAWSWPFLHIHETKQFSEALKAWSRIGARLFIWDYTVNFGFESLPMPNLPVILPNIRYYLEHNVEGVMLQGSSTPGAENARLRCWVWAKQLWDARRETRPLMRDFVFGYYGRSAEPIWAYNELLWRIWMRGHADDKRAAFRDASLYEIQYKPDVTFLSRRFLSVAARLFERAEALADSPVVRRRVRVAKLPILYTRLAQALGVVRRQPRCWVGPGNELQRVLRGRPFHGAVYAPWVEEVAQIVREEKMTHFGEDFRRLPVPHTQAVIDMWRSLACDIPPVQAQALAATWKFQVDPGDRGEARGWFAPDLDDRAWRDVSTDLDPGAGHVGWEAVPGLEKYAGVAWYRQEFVLSPRMSRLRNLKLIFPVVKREAEIWLNGRKVCVHTRASTGLGADEIGVNEAPIILDGRGVLTAGRNRVAARVKAWISGVDQRCGICKPVVLLGSAAALPPPQASMLTYLAIRIRQEKERRRNEKAVKSNRP